MKRWMVRRVRKMVNGVVLTINWLDRRASFLHFWVLGFCVY